MRDLSKLGIMTLDVHVGYIIGFSEEVPTRRRILLPIYLTHKRTDEFDFIMAL